MPRLLTLISQPFALSWETGRKPVFGCGWNNSFCATSCMGVAPLWFDRAGWLVYVGWFLGGGFNISILTRRGSCSLHSLGGDVLHSLQGVTFSKLCSPNQVMGEGVAPIVLLHCFLFVQFRHHLYLTPYFTLLSFVAQNSDLESNVVKNCSFLNFFWDTHMRG